MSEDPRCCGSGTCIIDPDGRCWCGQQWDGQRMSHAPLVPATEHVSLAVTPAPVTQAPTGKKMSEPE